MYRTKLEAELAAEDGLVEELGRLPWVLTGDQGAIAREAAQRIMSRYERETWRNFEIVAQMLPVVRASQVSGQ